MITSYTDAITQALQVLHERILEHDLKTAKARNLKEIEGEEW